MSGTVWLTEGLSKLVYVIENEPLSLDDGILTEFNQHSLYLCACHPERTQNELKEGSKQLASTERGFTFQLRFIRIDLLTIDTTRRLSDACFLSMSLLFVINVSCSCFVSQIILLTTILSHTSRQVRETIGLFRVRSRSIYHYISHILRKLIIYCDISEVGRPKFAFSESKENVQ